RSNGQDSHPFRSVHGSTGLHRERATVGRSRERPRQLLAMPTDRLLAGLKQSSVFRGLGAASLESLERVGSARELTAREVLIEEGREMPELFVVIGGELEVFLPKTASRLTRIRVARAVAGDCIGEYSLVDKNPASASVAAKSPSQIFTISHAEFERA